MSEKHSAARAPATGKEDTDKTKICPVCPLKCPLKTPSCEQGQRYADAQKKQEKEEKP